MYTAPLYIKLSFPIPPSGAYELGMLQWIKDMPILIGARSTTSFVGSLRHLLSPNESPLLNRCSTAPNPSFVL